MHETPSRGGPQADEVLLRAVSDAQPGLVWTSDAGGRCAFANRTWRDYTGLYVDVHQPIHWHDALHPDDVHVVRASWAAAIAGSDPFQVEVRLRGADGTFRWHVVRAAAMAAADGTERSWCLTALELPHVTEKRAAATQRLPERRRRDDPQAASERHFKAIADAAPAVLWMTDANGSCTFLSRGWFDLTGQTGDEALGLGWLDMLHPDDREASGRVFAQAIAECGAFALDHRLRRHDGAYRWVIDAGRPRFGQHGEFLGHIGSVIDVHERVLAEQTLRKSEERFRQLADAMPQIVWTASADGRTDYFNRRWYELTGATDSTRDDEGWLVVLHPDDRERCLDRWYHSVRTGEAYEIEYRFLFPETGEYRWHLGRGLPIRDEQGTVVRWFGTSTDIDDQKRMTEALRESEQRFRTLADNITQFAWIADARGDIVWYNQRWYDYTGTMFEDVRGWGWMKVHHPDHVDRVVARIQRSWDTGEAWEDTFPLRGRDGQYRWFLSRATPVRDEEGRILRWFGTNTDITEQRAAEAVLREADSRKDAFLAMLAHELRNPLGPVSNAARILTMVDGRDPMARRARDIIDRQVWHISRLVDDLLDVSRISRGQIQLRRQPCDLDAIVAEATDDYRQTLETGGLSVSIERGGPLPVDGDPTRLRQAVENLLHNALKFTDAGGRVVVRTAREEPAWAVVTVEDSGVGVDPTVIGTVFEPFTQADRSLDRTRGGLGLGLALVKGLVVLHGGDVTASSDGLGRGARFSFRLPLSAPQIHERRGALVERTSTPLRLLVVEDNADAAESLRLLLSLAGHEVAVAFDGPEALAAIEATPPDVVLCDVGLPRGMDGYDVARRVRANPALAAVSLVAVTGYGQEDDIQRAREAGFDQHLVKPVDFDRLMAVLEASSAPSRPAAGRRITAEGRAPSS